MPLRMRQRRSSYSLCQLGAEGRLATASCTVGVAADECSTAEGLLNLRDVQLQVNEGSDGAAGGDHSVGEVV